MLIVCPSCATSYNVEAASLRPRGRQVRCLRCRTVWLAEFNQADRLMAAAEALGPARERARFPEHPVDRWVQDRDQGPDAKPEIRGDERLLDQPVDLDAVATTEGGEPVGPIAAIEPGSGPATVPAPDQPSEPAEPTDAGDASPESAVAGAPDDTPRAGDDTEIEAPPIVPVDLDAGRPPIVVDTDQGGAGSTTHGEDIESIASRRSRGRPRRRSRRPGWPLSTLQTVIMLLVIVDSVVVGWRKDIVRLLPQTASFYSLLGLPVNLRGLAFDAVTSRVEKHEGVPILVVQGQIVNDSGAAVGLPRLRLAVRNGSRDEIYWWTAAPPRDSLLPGQTVAFHSRLASPPQGSRDVLVRFVRRSDMLADGR